MKKSNGCRNPKINRGKPFHRKCKKQRIFTNNKIKLFGPISTRKLKSVQCLSRLCFLSLCPIGAPMAGKAKASNLNVIFKKKIRKEELIERSGEEKEHFK
jgi:hypothetical protein